MGLGPSRLTYDMPPPPSLEPDESTLDLNANMLIDNIRDPEGYQMCRSVAIKEGILGAMAAMSGMGLTIMLTRKYASTSRVDSYSN